MAHGRRKPEPDGERVAGRTLRTRLDPSAGRRLFRELAAWHGLTELRDHDWPALPDQPTVFVSAGDAKGPGVYLALWEREVTTEVDLVAAEPGYADLPEALAALWVERDQSGEATGQVRWIDDVRAAGSRGLSGRAG